jgi:membrane-associated phospholipid phosphatase
MDLGLLMDPAVNAAFQNFSPAATPILARGEFLDSMPWYFILISLLFLGYSPKHGLRLAVLFGINSGLNEALKLAAHMPRPYWVSSSVKAFSASSSFGFPSGAAMTGAAIYGYIAWAIRRWWATLLCGILLLATSLARIFAGIHFPLDIIGGWTVGALLLVVFLLAAPKIEGYAQTLNWPARLAGIVLVASIPIVVVIPAYLSLGGWQQPPAWAELAIQQTGARINPAQIRYAWGGAGIVLGSLLGYELMQSQGGWKTPADLKQRTAVALAGTGSVLLVNNVLPLALSLSGIAAMMPQLATFLSMAGVTFWLTGCLPLIARRAGFGQKEGGPELKMRQHAMLV